MKYFKSILVLLLLVNYTAYSQEPAPDTNENLNWISTIGYRLDGQTISKGVSYYNELGKPTQSQSWDLLTGKVWNSQVLYDSQGRPALQSLSAPKGTSFGYQTNFIRTTGGATYSSSNFDTTSTIENPNTVGNQANSLGHYYSIANTNNPYQDVTSYPFTRTVYSTLNPGAAKKVIGGNKIDGEWKQTYSFSMIAGEELSQSNAFGSGFNNDTKIMKTISRDVHGIESIVFTNSDGHTLAVARSGNEGLSNPQISNNTVSITNQGWVDIHIANGCNGILGINNPEGIELKVYDLITESMLLYTTNYLSVNSGFYRIAVRYPENYQYNSNQPITITHKINYYDYALNYYDKGGRLKKSVQPNGTVTATPIDFTSYFNYNSLGQLLETTSPDEGTAKFKYRKDGQIRFSQNSKQVSNNEFSYTNYDNLGRPIESGVYSEGAITFESADNLLDLQDGLDDANCSEQHFTIYDIEDDKLQEALTSTGLSLSTYTQTFVDGNVSCTYTERPDTNRTWYSYDIYGRVKWLVQDIEGLGVKTINYTYDPVTGQAVKIDYQKYDAVERFIHKYEYNIAGQLTKVYTSIDGQTYTLQAEYFYNETGALKRTEIAEDLQGIDYVYNLNGQLKAINHPSLQASNDPGNDGANGFAADVFGFNINYYNGDYTRPSTPTPISANYGNQYNGNISSVDFQTQNVGSPQINTFAYSYNKNNWLTKAEFNKHTNTNQDYKVENITYDANGNLQTLKRNGYTDGSGDNSMDDFTYRYYSGKNQLDYIKDDADNTDVNRYPDLRNQEVPISVASDGSQIYGNNYTYNEIGQLITNKQDQVAYTYNASGLVTQVDKFSTTDTGSLTTIYLEDFNNYNLTEQESWMIDQGSVRYEFNDDLINPDGLTFMPICDDPVFEYGGSYAGRLQFNFSANYDGSINNLTAMKAFHVVKDVHHTIDFDLILIQLQKRGLNIVSMQSGVEKIQVFELDGHAETILAETSIPITNITEYCGNRYDEHVSLNFTPSANQVGLRLIFENTGAPIIGARPRNNPLLQTVELDNLKIQVAKEPVVAFEYDDKGHRIKKTTYLNAGGVSPYTAHTYYVRDASGSVMGIYNGHTLRGGETKLNELPVYGASRLGVTYNNATTRSQSNTVYQLADHLGNVRAVIAKDPTTGIAISSATDYYPFGMPMPNRQIVDGEPYRYAYQGQEKDPETGKEAFQLRLWDGRIGRWLTTDPYGQYFSPYLGMGNTPINGVDPDGGLFGRQRAWLYKLFNGGEIYKSERTGKWIWKKTYEKSGTRDGDIGEITIFTKNFGHEGVVRDIKDNVYIDFNIKVDFGAQIGVSTPIYSAGGGVLTQDLFNAGYSSEDGLYNNEVDGTSHNYIQVKAKMFNEKLAVSYKADFVTPTGPPDGSDLYEFYSKNTKLYHNLQLGPSKSYGYKLPLNLSGGKISAKLNSKGKNITIDVGAKFFLGIKGSFTIGLKK